MGGKYADVLSDIYTYRGRTGSSWCVLTADLASAQSSDHTTKLTGRDRSRTVRASSFQLS